MNKGGGGLDLDNLSAIMLKIIGNVIQVVWPLFALILVVAIGKFLYRLYEMKRLAESGINEIDKMDGKTFEN